MFKNLGADFLRIFGTFLVMLENNESIIKAMKEIKEQSHFSFSFFFKTIME